MPDDMGTFRVDVQIENPARPGERRTLTSVLVDTGAELSWVPAAVLESLGIERYATWRFGRPTGPSSNDGSARLLSTSRASARPTTSSSESPATSSYSAPVRSKGSTSASSPSQNAW